MHAKENAYWKIITFQESVKLHRLTYFMPFLPSPENMKKISSFLIFSGGIEKKTNDMTSAKNALFTQLFQFLVKENLIHTAAVSLFKGSTAQLRSNEIFEEPES